jgi:hypothetical protein
MYQKVSGLAVWSENCKWYSSLPLGAVVSLFYELDQWYSTGDTRIPWGTRRHLRGYVKFKISIYIFFHE